ncbi:uncharacterized protein [Amphiura filiformis]|uniref:uncharacterized protein n=1 Tax=Amphiura filiformis TaxID=82378 RepID=UPI003B2142EF
MAELASTSEISKHPTKDEIYQSLLAHDASTFFEGKPAVDIPRAAVLIPLFFKNEELYVLLTVRSQHLSTHGGDVAFPGGKQDEADADIVKTALREAEEEIGLPQDQVEVISKVVPSFAKHGILVTPIVGFISEDFVPQPNPDEVECAFSVPLADFLSDENHTSQPGTWQDRPYRLHFFHHPCTTKAGKKIVTWGLTAFMAMVVASMIYKRPPNFETDNWFNWENPTKAAEESYFIFLRRNGYLEQQEGSKL